MRRCGIVACWTRRTGGKFPSPWSRHGNLAMFLRPILYCVVMLLAGLRTTPAADEPKWKMLFDGKSLAGWKAADYPNSGKVHVKDGAVVLEKGKAMTGLTY